MCKRFICDFRTGKTGTLMFLLNQQDPVTTVRKGRNLCTSIVLFGRGEFGFTRFYISVFSVVLLKGKPSFRK